MKCDCQIVGNARGSDLEIEYCLLHKAAPNLVEALKEITELAPRDKLRLPYAKQVVEVADKALWRLSEKENNLSN